MTSRDPSHARACILTCPTHSEAQELASHLAEHAVPSRLLARPDGWLVSVAAADGALAAGLCGVEAPARSPSPPRRWSRHALGALAGALLAAVGYGVGLLATAPSAAMADVRTDRVAQSDDDGDGIVDRIVIFGSDGRPSAVWHDSDGDGAPDRIVRLYPDAGEAVELVDEDGDGLPESISVHDARGAHPGVFAAPRASRAPR